MNKICRRDFLKGAAAGAVSIAVAGLTSGGAMAEEVGAAAAVSLERNPQDEDYTTFTTDFSAIFSPLQVGSMTLRNRIAKPAAGSDTGDRNLLGISQNTLDYYGRMADGGAALILLETGILRSLGFDPNSLGNLKLENPEDGIELARPLAERVHAGGAYIGYQISFGGPMGEPAVNDLSLGEIKQFVQDSAACAARLQEAGYDCIEIKAATADGLNAFLTRRQNRREDEYGPQSFENRARFLTEMIQAIKAECGKDFNVLMLINAMEENDKELGQNDKYITIEEAKAFAQLLEAAGADLIQVRTGLPGMEITCWAPDANHAAYKANGLTGYGTQFDYSAHFGGMLDGSHSGLGAFIPAASAIKSVVGIPVGCAGYMDPRTAPDMMNDAVESGDIDLLFMNRPLTVDPELPNKLQVGLRDEVAPCTRCLHCHCTPLGFPQESCRVNATTQYAYKEAMPEGYDLIPAETVKNVMVVGGGPAGMEAARIAAERGHMVTLYEAKAFLGGTLPFASAIKGKHERLDDLRSYLVRQQELKGVAVVTEQLVDADFVAAQNPDAVILALGGLRDIRFTGTVNVDDILSAEVGERVVILGAGAQAVDLAVYLLAQGKKIQMVHGGTASEVDKEQSPWFQLLIPPHLYAQGVKIWNETEALEIVDDGLVIKTDAGLEKTLECDTVIECHDMLPNADLYEAIKDKYEVYAVGDCDAPFNIQQAIHNANLAARKI